jgi:hypothetical protein
MFDWSLSQVIRCVRMSSMEKKQLNLLSLPISCSHMNGSCSFFLQYSLRVSINHGTQLKLPLNEITYWMEEIGVSSRSQESQSCINSSSANSRVKFLISNLYRVHHCAKHKLILHVLHLYKFSFNSAKIPINKSNRLFI